MEVKKAKSAIAERNKDIQKKNNKKDELLAKNNDIQLKIKEHSHEIKKLEDSFKNALHRVRVLTIFFVFLQFFVHRNKNIPRKLKKTIPI